MLTLRRHLATLLVATVPLFTLGKDASAQVSFQACSPGTLANCTDIRLSTQLGVGAGGTNLLEIALLNLGSMTSPNLATSLYYLSFSTGLAAVPSGSELEAAVTPVASGGATISDASAWDFIETGDAFALAALGNNGIGGCATSLPVGGFGQMARTCGANQFITFSFFTPRAFDPSKIKLTGLEITSIAAGNASDSCNDATPCKISPLGATTTTPEPRTFLLIATALIGIALFRLFRRVTVITTLTPMTEVK